MSELRAVHVPLMYNRRTVPGTQSPIYLSRPYKSQKTAIELRLEDSNEDVQGKTLFKSTLTEPFIDWNMVLLRLGQLVMNYEAKHVRGLLRSEEVRIHTQS